MVNGLLGFYWIEMGLIWLGSVAQLPKVVDACPLHVPLNSRFKAML